MLLGLQNIMDDFICALQKKLLLQGMEPVCAVCALHVACRAVLRSGATN
jgi:succinate dehydrogenase hydrophobic anchor subunit